jgi:hypothetical protein
VVKEARPGREGRIGAPRAHDVEGKFAFVGGQIAQITAARENTLCTLTRSHYRI